MNLTDYHAKYFAHELTRRCPPDSAEKLAGAVASAQVDLSIRSMRRCSLLSRRFLREPFSRMK